MSFHIVQRRFLFCYKAPWSDRRIMEEQSVDVIFSQATMEHVDDLTPRFRNMSDDDLTTAGLFVRAQKT